MFLRERAIRRAQAPQGLLRLTFESLVLLAAAVAIFRTFIAEGYMISTGSMAPTLLGYHRHLCCPACHCEFDRGASASEPDGVRVASASTDRAELDECTQVTARCPNCGAAVPETSIPRTEGDQLMVHKHHYLWRDPARWEVVVFRNPELQSQAYVKRAVGLPGESIEIVDGDVYADGVLQRKPLDVQQALRILIDDSDHQPDANDPDWRPRWRAASPDTKWRTDGRQFRFSSPPDEAARAGIDWVHYHHWLRAGGRHACRVPLVAWPRDVAEPGLLSSSFRFDPEAHALESVGAIPHATYADWVSRVSSADVQEALTALYLKSHQPPLSDLCAYNHPDAAEESYAIHDLMLELTLTALRPAGEVCLSMHDGCHELICTLDLEAGEARLTADDRDVVHRRAVLPESLRNGDAVVVTMSQFDRQVIVAVNGEELFEPLLYAADENRAPLPEHPVRFGARGADVAVTHVRLDRDVYYTAPADGVEQTYQLADDEFFMLGDNSPVSLDSRAWRDPAVPRSLLIGRPFVVHLPSRSRRVVWGEREFVLRVPDFARVRYIR